jgi:hypothetical protein
MFDIALRGTQLGGHRAICQEEGQTMRMILAIGVLLALAACGSGDDPLPTRETGPAPLSDFALKVSKLTEVQRNGVFLRAIRDSGIACQEVLASESIEIRSGVMGWRAQCQNGSPHLVEILADGTAKITSRAD